VQRLEVYKIILLSRQYGAAFFVLDGHYVRKIKKWVCLLESSSGCSKMNQLINSKHGRVVRESQFRLLSGYYKLKELIESMKNLNIKPNTIKVTGGIFLISND
jgi:hypothetical protein